MTPDTDEILTFLGAGAGAPEDLRRAVSLAAADLAGQVPPRYVWRAFPLEDMPLILSGRTAGTMLRECREAVLLLCTLGHQFDARIRSAQARDMAEAVILDACGSALVEAGCGAAEKEIAGRFPGRFLTDRFSPGYGDLSLSLQREICDLLDGGRRLGVRVTDQFLMIPSKTVSAVIGIADRPQMARIRGCAHCAIRESCVYRKGGRRCGTV